MTILMEILKPKSDNCPAAPQPALQGESVYNEKTKSRKKGRSREGLGRKEVEPAKRGEGALNEEPS